MFRGHFEHAIDAKGRTSLPSRFRDVLIASGDLRIVMAPSLLDACLDVYPLKAWEELEAKIAALPRFDQTILRLRRLYVSAAVDCEVDKQGRVLVPNTLREHARLASEVLWAGMGQTIELWAKEQWGRIQTFTDDEKVEFQRVLAEQVRI
jgi:MraZ protein